MHDCYRKSDSAAAYLHHCILGYHLLNLVMPLQTMTVLTHPPMWGLRRLCLIAGGVQTPGVRRWVVSAGICVPAGRCVAARSELQCLVEISCYRSECCRLFRERQLDAIVVVRSRGCRRLHRQAQRRRRCADGGSKALQRRIAEAGGLFGSEAAAGGGA